VRPPGLFFSLRSGYEGMEHAVNLPAKGSRNEKRHEIFFARRLRVVAGRLPRF
jgi:hypothetical protein